MEWLGGSHSRKEIGESALAGDTVSPRNGQLVAIPARHGWGVVEILHYEPCGVCAGSKPTRKLIVCRCRFRVNAKGEDNGTRATRPHSKGTRATGPHSSSADMPS